MRETKLLASLTDWSLPMPSTRFTKVNIDVDTYALLQTLAAGRGVSVTTLLEQIILSYLQHQMHNRDNETKTD